MEELAERGVVGFKAFMSNSGIEDFDRADDDTLRRGMEVAARHNLIVAVHAAWLISLWLWGRDQPVDPLALGVFIVLQGLRAWVIATLSARWTTRIVVLPDQPLISSGPYRYLSHPNYAVVAAEIAVLPLALHLPVVAVVFTILNAAVLTIRIRAENAALAGAPLADHR